MTDPVQTYLDEFATIKTADITFGKTTFKVTEIPEETFAILIEFLPIRATEQIFFNWFSKVFLILSGSKSSISTQNSFMCFPLKFLQHPQR